MKKTIAFIILTRNEEQNLKRCLESIKPLASEIFVVDSFSVDRTREIADSFRAVFVENKFENQAQQFNWALDNLDIKSDWIFRVDADEYITPELREEINEKIDEIPEDVMGLYLKRRVYFMGRWIKHGGYYPIWFLRLFRKGAGRSEERKMDERIILLRGRAEKFHGDFVDDNKKGLSDWIRKHNDYATREAEDFLAGNEWLGKKRSAYYNLPSFLRPILYFIYRYFLRLGILDGKTGLVFHVLHAFWYRFLVDAKIREIKISNKFE